MWYRANKMSGVVYAVPFDENDLEFQVEDIDTFVRQGDTIVLCDDLEGVAEIFDIGVDDIEIVN